MNKIINIMSKISFVFAGLGEIIIGLLTIFVDICIWSNIKFVYINDSLMYTILVAIVLFGAAILCIVLGILDIMKTFD